MAKKFDEEKNLVKKNVNDMLNSLLQDKRLTVFISRRLKSFYNHLILLMSIKSENRVDVPRGFDFSKSCAELESELKDYATNISSKINVSDYENETYTQNVDDAIISWLEKFDFDDDFISYVNRVSEELRILTSNCVHYSIAIHTGIN